MAPRTPGYIGRRLAFIIVWLFIGMLPVGNPDANRTEDPAYLFLVVVIGLTVLLVPPIVAARQIYRAYVRRP